MKLAAVVLIGFITSCYGLTLSEKDEGMKEFAEEEKGHALRKRNVLSSPLLTDIPLDKLAELCGRCDKADEKPTVVCQPPYQKNPHSNTCIRLIKTTKTWEDANNYCIIAGERLATFETLESAFWLMGLRKTNSEWRDNEVYIGGKRSEGVWRWIGTSALVDTIPWQDGQPDSRPGGEDCLSSVQKYHYRYNDVGCQQSFPFVCEKLP